MKDKILPYLKMMPLALLVGCVAFTALYLAMGWEVNAYFWWNVGRNGVLTMLIWIGNAAISEEITISWTDYPVRRLIVSFLLTIFVTLLIAKTVDIAYLLLRYGSIPEEIYARFEYWSVLIITFIISSFMHGRSFLFSYKAAIVEGEELKRANLAGRYESLQNQVNPHFLFNSLNVLSSLVYKDADLSAKFIEQLAEVYRYVLEARHHEVVPLADEKKMLDAYLFLLGIRFEEQLDVSVDLPTTPDDVVPPLVLQMLVENAVKHNVASRRKPLRLRITREGDTLAVWNSFQPKQQLHTSLGVGLENIRERYVLLSKKSPDIRRDDTGFEVRLPILKMNEYAIAAG